VASGSGEPEGNGAEATRFPFPLPGATIGEQKAKVNTFSAHLFFFISAISAPLFLHSPSPRTENFRISFESQSRLTTDVTK
jgi:hypothetical protein